VLRADKGLLRVILKEPLDRDYDCLTFSERLLPVIEAQLREEGISLDKRDGSLDLPLSSYELQMSDLSLGGDT